MYRAASLGLLWSQSSMSLTMISRKANTVETMKNKINFVELKRRGKEHFGKEDISQNNWSLMNAMPCDWLYLSFKKDFCFGLINFNG